MKTHDSDKDMLLSGETRGPRSTAAIASLSCDLDDKWSYMKTHGDPGWETLPSYLDIVVPRILNALKQRSLKATFFIVGQDAALTRNQMLFRAISDAGHEIGNHSFHHEPWLHLHSMRDIALEIGQAEEAIQRATGQTPLGFRGPGYSLSEATLHELVRRGYTYDASTFPTFISPLVRLYYFATARLSPEEKTRRKALGGTFRDGLRPNRPYYWHIDGKQLYEIPVTTFPGLRLPIHMSYLFGLRRISSALALGYLNFGLHICRLARVQPSFVLHPTDFLGNEDGQALPFIPGMALPREVKVRFVGEVLDRLQAHFAIVTLRDHAALADRQAPVPVLNPSF
jgi:peptidoglycan/xylan/chitin deacetylase (PgdA/CDA1 family)